MNCRKSVMLLQNIRPDKHQNKQTCLLIGILSFSTVKKLHNKNIKELFGWKKAFARNNKSTILKENEMGKTTLFCSTSYINETSRKVLQTPKRCWMYIDFVFLIESFWIRFHRPCFLPSRKQASFCAKLINRKKGFTPRWLLLKKDLWERFSHNCIFRPKHS